MPYFWDDVRSGIRMLVKYPMLSVVGRPTAVNPDLRLRTVARSYDWPIIDLR